MVTQMCKNSKRNLVETLKDILTVLMFKIQQTENDNCVALFHALDKVIEALSHET